MVNLKQAIREIGNHMVRIYPNQVIRVEYNGYSAEITLKGYTWYIEYGRNEGKMPPIDTIEDWIKVRNIIPYSVDGKIPTTRQLAFLIARSIGENGTYGKHRWSDEMDKIDVEEILISALRKDVIELLNG